MNSVKLSVIIPVLSSTVPGAVFKTLESVLSQSLRELEVICVTADNAQQIQGDQRVHTISCPGRSAGAMAGEGLKCAVGSFIHFLLPGDTVPEYAYQCAVNKAVKYELDCLKCAGVAYDDHLGSPIDLSRYTLSHLRTGDFHRLLSLKEERSPLLTVTHAPWTMLLRRSALEAGHIGYPDLEECAGSIFYYRVISGSRRVMCSRDTLVVHHLPPFRGNAALFDRELKARCRGLYLLEEGLDADGMDEDDALCLFRDAMNRLEQRCKRWHRLLGEDPEEMEAVRESLQGSMEVYQGRFHDLCLDRLQRIADLLHGKPENREPAICEVYTRKASKHPKVSVVVPVYNVEDYLNEALHSLRIQTLEELEVLCVNDGSTDGSMAILQQYAARDKRFRILDGPNGGYGKAMNRGIDAATGEYLGILEPDDFVRPDMFRRLYALAVKRKVDFVKADFYRFVVRPDGSLQRTRNHLAPDDGYYGRLVDTSREIETFKFIMNTWSGIYKLEFLNRWHIRHNETPGASYQDNGFWFQTFCRATRAWFVKKPYYMNRRDNPNSSMFARNKMYCITEEYRYIWDWMSKEPELLQRFAPIYYVKKLGNYLVTLHRIAEELRPEYLQHICQEFRALVEQRKLRADMVGEIDWMILKEILDDPEGYANRIRVSVIIPVYNGEENLRQCLDSILIRREIPIEVICVDDGSTDRSLEILREYQRNYPRVTVLTQENAGAGAARNNALQYARGEYLSFLDADDFFEPGMLRLAYHRAHSKRADIVAFRSDQYIQSTGEYLDAAYTINQRLLPEEQPFAGLDIRRDAFKLFVGWAWDKLFRTEFVRETGVLFQEQRTSNDMLFVFSHVVKARRIVTMNKVLAHHRRDGGSLSVTREQSWSCFYFALLALRRQLKKWDLWQRFERDFVNYAQHFTLWNLTTLRGRAYYALYEQLNSQWLAELDLLRHPRFYYYNDYEYQKLRCVTSMSAEDFLYQELDEARSQRSELGREVKELGAENLRLADQVTNLTENKKELTEARQQLRQDNRELKKKLKKLQNSREWKLGRMLTWLPRKLKRWLKRKKKK